MAANGLKVQIAVSMQLQRALCDPSQVSRDTLFYLKIKNLKKNLNEHLNTNAHFALALRCASVALRIM